MFFSVLGDGVAVAGAQPADIQTGFLASLSGRSPSQRFVGGPGEGGGTPFAWLNIPVCSSPVMKHLFLYEGVNGHGRHWEGGRRRGSERRSVQELFHKFRRSRQVCHHSLFFFSFFFSFFFLPPSSSPVTQFLFFSAWLILPVWILFCLCSRYETQEAY